MNTEELIKRIVEGGLGGMIAWFVLGKIPVMATLSDFWRRAIAWAVTITLGLAAWSLGLAIGITPAPASAQAWADMIVWVAFMSVTTSQMAHKALKQPQ